jgi:hypothetical protein
MIALEIYPVAIGDRNVDFVSQRDRGHQRLDVVISIRALRENPEHEVDFGWSLNCHAGSIIRQCLFLPKKKSSSPSIPRI